MFGLTPNTRVFVKSGVTDGRYGIDRLRQLALQVVKQNPQEGHLFCFSNRTRNRLRLLWWDGTGFFLATKRLERGQFDFPQREDAVQTLTVTQLHTLIQQVRCKVDPIVKTVFAKNKI
jgi:transposase